MSDHVPRHKQQRPDGGSEGNLKPFARNIPEDVRYQWAQEMLAEGKLKYVKSAAVVAGMKESTFRHRRLGRRSFEAKIKAFQALTPLEEDLLIERCAILCECGFPPSCWRVFDMAVAMGQRRDPNFMLESRWLDHQFYKRHGHEIRTRYSQEVESIRADRGSDIRNLLEFFRKFLKIVTENKVLLENTYNLDETGFEMGVTTSQVVLEVMRHVRRNGKLFERATSGSKEYATVIETICADGSKLDPAVIYKATSGNLQSHWFTKYHDACGVPREILFGTSPNGWTDQKMALKYLARNFGPGSHTEKKAQGRWRMLIFDGHNSHVNASFLNRCLEYHVIPFCLPPHTSHRTQPLDVSVFSPLKNAYQRALQNWFSAGYRGVTKENFWLLLVEAREEAMTPANIISGFTHTGLGPASFAPLYRQIAHEAKLPKDDIDKFLSSFDPTLWQALPADVTPPHEVVERRTALAASPLAATPELETPPPPETTFDHDHRSSREFTTPKRCRDWDTEQVGYLTTPQHLSELRHLRGCLELEFPEHGSPHTWKRRKFIEKVLNCAEKSMHREVNHRDDLTSLRTQMQQDQERRRRKRRSWAVPDEGRAWLSLNEISAMTAEQEAKKTAERAKQIERTRAAELRQIEAMRLAMQRLQKKQEMEETGRIDKRFTKSVAQLQQEVNDAEVSLQQTREKLVSLGASRTDGEQPGEVEQEEEAESEVDEFEDGRSFISVPSEDDVEIFV